MFAGIALLVATFSIYNTFSIIIAQRTRESALLRAIGASRGQVLWSVALEALAMGFVASILGLLAGVGLAAGLRSIVRRGRLRRSHRRAHGEAEHGRLGVRGGHARHAGRDAVPGHPRRRACRRSPRCATSRSTGRARRGSGSRSASLFTVGGVVLVIAAAVGGGGIAPAGFGAVLTIIGVVVLGPIVAKPAARGTRRAAPAPPPHDRPARTRERDAQPAPYRRNRGRAHGRRRRRHAVHRVRGVGQGLRRRDGEQAVRRRPRRSPRRTSAPPG